MASAQDAVKNRKADPSQTCYRPTTKDRLDYDERRATRASTPAALGVNRPSRSETPLDGVRDTRDRTHPVKSERTYSSTPTQTSQNHGGTGRGEQLSLKAFPHPRPSPMSTNVRNYAMDRPKEII